MPSILVGRQAQAPEHGGASEAGLGLGQGWPVIYGVFAFFNACPPRSWSGAPKRAKCGILLHYFSFVPGAKRGFGGGAYAGLGRQKRKSVVKSLIPIPSVQTTESAGDDNRGRVLIQVACVDGISG